MEFFHKSVMLEECIDFLDIKPDGVYVDGTVGGAGHSKRIAEKLNDNGMLVAIDRDPDAVTVATERLSGYNAVVVKRNFSQIREVLDELEIDKVDGVLLDLGVSSHQLDKGERGFSYHQDAPLDMRMDQSLKLTAEEVVNEYSETELKRVIKDFGEERFASSIARKIVEYRKKSRIQTTKSLEKIILSAVPRYRGNDGSSNVQRTFQAIRIEVNKELDGLDQFIKDAVDCLNENGRLAIITFHSLEDRIVKHTFRSLATGCTCPSDFPICVCGNKPKVKIITNHPIIADDQELKLNRRSASAKLRIAQKI